MINQTCNLVLNDLFSYDIVAAYPTIMTNVDWDFSGVDLTNKTERSIQIGLAQKDNENLSSYLMNSADSLVDFYLKDNNIKDEEIIVTQRDGFILKKSLYNTDEFISMKFRGMIDTMIISIDRTKYIAIDVNGVTIKGVARLYDKLYDIYKLFGNLNFFDKKILFSQLNFIKNSFLESKDKDLFCVPYDGKLAISTIKHGNLLVQDTGLFDIEDINKVQYYEHYFKPFLQSIYLECY